MITLTLILALHMMVGYDCLRWQVRREEMQNELDVWKVGFDLVNDLM